MPTKPSNPLVDAILARVKASEADEEVLRHASALLPLVEEIPHRIHIEQGRRQGLMEAIEEIRLSDAF